MTLLMSTQDQYERFLSFLEVDPYNVQLLANTANLASELGHYGQAIELADRGLTLEPKHQVLLSTKALACLSSGDVDSALTQFQQLLDDGQHEPIVRYNLAYCLMLKEQDEQALTLLDDALEQYGELPQMVTLKMRAIYTMGELDKAIELGKQALAANPDDGSVHEIMSSLYFDSSDFVSAQQHAMLALNVNPNLGSAHTSIGMVALNTQDEAIAESRFDEAIRLNKRDGRAWLGKAMVEMLKQNLTQAEPSFKSAIQFMPTHLGSYLALAWCQISQHKLDEAETTAMQAMAIDGNFSEIHGTLAVLAVFKGDIENANKLSRYALAFDRSSFSGLYALALIQAATGHAERSQRIIDTILDAPTTLDQGNLRNYLAQYVKNKTPGSNQTKH